MFLKRLGSLMVVILIAPFLLVLGPPIGGAALGAELAKQLFRSFGHKTWFGFFASILIIIIGFILGSMSTVVIGPLVIVLGIPGFIFIQIYERVKKRNHAKERLKARMLEAMEL